MPIYEYYHPATGECLEALRSVAERDMPPRPGFLRRTAPSRVGGSLARHLSAPSMREGVLRGYYQQEQQHGSRFRSAFSPSQIKAAWDHPR